MCENVPINTISSIPKNNRKKTEKNSKKVLTNENQSAILIKLSHESDEKHKRI